MKLDLQKFLAVASVGLLTLGFCQQTQGVPINGAIEQIQGLPINGAIAFLGSGSATQGGGTSTINFTNPFNTIGVTASYTSVPNYTPVTFQNFSFTGSGHSPILSGTVVPL